MKKTTMGYIVMGLYAPLRLCRFYRGAGKTPILAHGRDATVFKTRREAQRAIDRTDRYAAERGYTNAAWTTHTIVRLARDYASAA